MRIGLVTGEYPPDRGGVGDFTDRLAHALAQLGHRVHVITSRREAPEGAHAPDGSTPSLEPVRIHRAVNRWGFGCWTTLSRIARELSLDMLNIQYQAAAYQMRPAINFVPKRRRVAVVATFHDLKVPYLFPKAGPLRRWVVYALARRADGIIVTNRQDELELTHAGLDEAKLTRIPIGSNIAVSLPAGYDRNTERSRYGIGPNDLLLGYFGFLNESKGGEELIKTLHLLVQDGMPAYLLKIGGRVGASDPTNRAYADRVEKMIEDLNLARRVHWTGYVDAERVSASLRAVDVCVLPYRDGVSFRRGSLLACIAHGRPIVTTRPSAPLPEIENGQNMLLVEPETPSQLAEAVRRIATEPILRSRLEAGAESLAAGFEWDHIAKWTTSFFSRVLEGGP